MQQYSNILVSDIIDRAKAEAIGSTASQLTALQDTQLIERVEQINSDFINAAHLRHNLGGWSWMREIQNFSTKTKTTLNGAISAGDATMILTSAADFDSSGRVVLETSNGSLDFVDYESKSSNTLTVSTTSGDSPIGFDHLDGANVEKLYALPSDYAKTERLMLGSNEFFYSVPRLYPQTWFYTLSDGYILFPRGLKNDDITHYYQKKPATLTALSNTTDIPSNFQRYAIEQLKAHIYFVRRKRGDIQASLELSEVVLDEALNYDANTTTSSISYGGIDTDY